MKLRWSARAMRDLAAIEQYITARDNRVSARRWINTLRKSARRAVRNPYAKRKVPEEDREDLREVLEGNYRIAYLIEPNTVTIARVFEGHLPFPGLR